MIEGWPHQSLFNVPSARGNLFFFFFAVIHLIFASRMTPIQTRAAVMAAVDKHPRRFACGDSRTETRGSEPRAPLAGTPSL